MREDFFFFYLLVWGNGVIWKIHKIGETFQNPFRDPLGFRVVPSRFRRFHFHRKDNRVVRGRFQQSIERGRWHSIGKPRIEPIPRTDLQRMVGISFAQGFEAVYEFRAHLCHAEPGRV